VHEDAVRHVAAELRRYWHIVRKELFRDHLHGGRQFECKCV
jgi:hypothetical protein